MARVSAPIPPSSSTTPPLPPASRWLSPPAPGGADPRTGSRCQAAPRRRQAAPRRPQAPQGGAKPRNRHLGLRRLFVHSFLTASTEATFGQRFAVASVAFEHDPAAGSRPTPDEESRQSYLAGIRERCPFR